MKLVYNFFSIKDVAFIQSIIGLLLFILVLILFFVKSSRDERGRAIIGKASIISTIFCLVITSVFGQTLPEQFNIFILANIIQFIFNSVIFVEIICILILRKIYL